MTRCVAILLFLATHSSRLCARRVINQNIEESKKHRASLSASPSEGTASSLCGSTLVISFSTSASALSLATSNSESRSFSFAGWNNRKLFTSKFTDTSGRNCEKTYTGLCERGGVEVTRICHGLARKSVSFKCLGGFGCLLSKGRQSAVPPGGEIELILPTETKRRCTFKMTSGRVAYEARDTSGSMSGVIHSFNTQIARSTDVAAVARWIAKASSQDVCGEAALSVHTRADISVERNLVERSLALSAKYDTEGNRDGQAVYALWALYFEEQHHRIIGNRMQRLASDITLVQSSWSIGSDIRDERMQKSGGLTALFHHFQGIHRWPKPSKKKRVVIYTCSFGGGHKSAAKAVKGYLDADTYDADSLRARRTYDVTMIDTTTSNPDEVFFNSTKIRDAKVFNKLIIKRQQYWMANRFGKFQSWQGLLHKSCPSPGCNTDLKQRYRISLLSERPDLIVTVFHMELMPIYELAKELGNIPILHLATDMDIKMHEIFSPTARPIYNKFLVGVPFDLERSWDSIAPLKREQTFLSGYPVRSSFLLPFNEDDANKHKSKLVPANTKVLLIVTGGAGQDTPWPYMLAESGIGMPLHIIVVAGGSNDLAEKLHRRIPNVRQFPDGREVWYGNDAEVTVEVATDDKNTDAENPFFILEEKMLLLMDIADVVLSKPGGGSTSEIAYRGVPAIFDTSVELFHWEQFTVDIFVQKGRAFTFSHDLASFRAALVAAMALERSQELAKTVGGKFLDPRVEIPNAARRLLDLKCDGSKIFADGLEETDVGGLDMVSIPRSPGDIPTL